MKMRQFRMRYRKSQRNIIICMFVCYSRPVRFSINNLIAKYTSVWWRSLKILMSSLKNYTGRNKGQEESYHPLFKKKSKFLLSLMVQVLFLYLMLTYIQATPRSSSWTRRETHTQGEDSNNRPWYNFITSTSFRIRTGTTITHCD